VQTVEHPDIGAYDAVRNPVRFDGQRHDVGSAPPSLGQHTEAILRELSASKTKKAAARSSRSSPPPTRRSRS
jgi:crotonobetainyl-CoA:carnitine CoA-transferase CaiB-like acyl-CoA transferase